MSTKPKDQTDIAAGLFFMALGGFFGWQALQMEIGTSIRMGPGYFPMVLSAILYAPGSLLYVWARREQGKKVFERTSDIVILALATLGAIVGVYWIATGYIVL